MTAREADEVLVSNDASKTGRVFITVVHGRYETALNVSAGELVRLRAAIDAHLSTPPADDVREALLEAIGAHLYGEKSPARLGAIRLADMILSDPRIEVRPRGTVTEPPTRPQAEGGVWGSYVEYLVQLEAAANARGTVTDAEGTWEYGVRHVAVDGWPTERAHVSLEDARADLETCGMNCHLIRRRSARDVGPWESFDATGEARS